jgi:hypothetical protein
MCATCISDLNYECYSLPRALTAHSLWSLYFLLLLFLLACSGPWNNDDTIGVIGLETRDASSSHHYTASQPPQQSSVLVDMGKVVGVLRTHVPVVRRQLSHEDEDDEEEDDDALAAAGQDEIDHDHEHHYDEVNDVQMQHYNVPTVNESGCVSCGAGGNGLIQVGLFT